MADAVGVRPPTWQRIEGGGQRPDVATLVAAARVLGVTVEWIVTGGER